MKIQYASDLHLERRFNEQYLRENPIEPVGDILILAGDITHWDKEFFKNRFFDYLSAKFKWVYYVPGNHEFYGGKDIKVLRKPICEKIRANIYVVSNVVITIGGIDFIFAPLWSHIPVQDEEIIRLTINDFNFIKYRNRLFTVRDHNTLHVRLKKFLTNALQSSEAKHKIVVTHHVPTYMCNGEKYKNSDVNSAFVTEMHDLIEDSKVDYWIYGHHHFNHPIVTIGSTKLVTNQLGYVDKGKSDGYINSAFFELK